MRQRFTDGAAWPGYQTAATLSTLLQSVLVKTRLLRAFDEIENLGSGPPAQTLELLVVECSLESPLATLDL